jgi:hypothetical protein
MPEPGSKGDPSPDYCLRGFRTLGAIPGRNGTEFTGLFFPHPDSGGGDIHGERTGTEIRRDSCLTPTEDTRERDWLLVLLLG